jgi:acetate kinase
MEVLHPRFSFRHQVKAWEWPIAIQLNGGLFCGGIGENAWRLPDRAYQGFEWLGIEMDGARIGLATRSSPLTVREFASSSFILTKKS